MRKEASRSSQSVPRGGEEAIDPRKPGLLAVIRVENDGNTVERGNLVDVFGTGDGSRNGGLIGVVVDGLTGDELSTALGEGNHDGTSVGGSSFHARVDGVGTYNVDSGDGVSLFLGGIEEVCKGRAGDNTRLDGGGKLSERLCFRSGFGLSHVQSTVARVERGGGRERSGRAGEEGGDSELHLDNLIEKI